MRRQPSFIDKHVGARLRAARLEAGKSQTQVAEALGVTFQQLQKYEKGTNRMSAGTLHELSRLLDTPVQFFFDGLGGVAGRRGNKEVAALDPVIRFAGTAEGRKVVMAFERADPKLRRLLAQHIEAIVRLTAGSAGACRPRRLHEAIAAGRKLPCVRADRRRRSTSNAPVASAAQHNAGSQQRRRRRGMRDGRVLSREGGRDSRAKKPHALGN